MKSHFVTLGIILIIIIGGLIVAQIQPCRASKVTLPDATVITAEVADSYPERSRGLSNRDSLDADKGMLFLFTKSDQYGFWMKDTRIPLDIIWINNAKVVDLVTLEPQSGDNIPQYTPAVEANAVLELNSGQAVAHNVALGEPITWQKCEL